ncbi:MAG: RtcB family protein [Planctomycetes bacterium]|nr:RtcB family protein [Planctomycetota bacterium]
MKKKEMMRLGVPRGRPLDAAVDALKAALRAGAGKNELGGLLEKVAKAPGEYLDDAVFGRLAREIEKSREARAAFVERSAPAPCRIWGEGHEPEALRQMENACRLPVSVRGALMPDAHLGYGLPIGGVLATRDSVIPYAVGMDIACRMKLTVLDMPVRVLEDDGERLKRVLERETCFGVGGGFRNRKQHPVMDGDWTVSPVTRRMKDRAWEQLGSSGAGNHFVEYGILEVERGGLGVAPGRYLAVLSHGGSRGTGGETATHYSRVAMDAHRELPRELSHLAWLDLDSEAGQEYWLAMELMGRYAAANHSLIHGGIARSLGAGVLLDIENHHNFAWKEKHYGEDVVVHRKGATPAGRGAIGIIPGSMATRAFVVRGKGEAESLDSAAHGAGRRMSRKQALATYSWKDLKAYLAERGVTLISAGLDEAPMAYKDIEDVMEAQADLVEVQAHFQPKIVKMAPGKGRG